MVRPTEPIVPSVDTRPLYRKKRFIIPASLVALIVIASVFGDPPPEDEPLRVDVSQFIGQTPDDAHNQLEDMLEAEMTTDYDDFSPRGRDVNRYEDIIVVADRKVVTADKPKILFWTLAPGELKWFEAHTKMPKAKIGARCDMDYGAKVFEPVDDLVFVASKPGTKRPKDAQQFKEKYDYKSTQTEWPTDWAAPQRRSVGDQWEAYDNAYPGNSVIQGQAPKADTALKPGQLMVVYCTSSEFDDSPPSDNEVPIPPVPNNKDDDFDFPDRFCPTRFC